jgi:hypothetical protein
MSEESEYHIHIPRQRWQSTPTDCRWMFIDTMGSGGVVRGGVRWVYHRWHVLDRLGLWTITLAEVNYAHFHPMCRNIHAVMDDFGDLIPVE